MIEHLSYSAISTYLLCAKSWEYRYVIKPPTQTAAALVFGSAFHDAVERFVKQPGDLATYWAESWATQLDSPRNQDIAWGDDSPETLEATGARMMAASIVQDTIAKIRPLMVNGSPVIEKFVTMRVPGVDVPIIGYIDVITDDGVPGDFKTAGRKWPADRAQGETQPVFYLVALNQEGWPHGDGQSFRHYVFTKTLNPTAQRLPSKHTLQQQLMLFDMVTNVWRGIQAGSFPCNTGTWKCSPRWCEYYQICQV